MSDLPVSAVRFYSMVHGKRRPVDLSDHSGLKSLKSTEYFICIEHVCSILFICAIAHNFGYLFLFYYSLLVYNNI